MTDDRIAAVEAYVQALRTGERSAADRAGRVLAPDVVLAQGGNEIAGYERVLARISGQWPLTPVYLHGAWSAPQADGDRLVVHADGFGPLGAAPKSVRLSFEFNAAGQVVRVEQQNEMPPAPQSTDVFPDFVRGAVNAALANGTPMVLAYVDEAGRPVQSLRGSTQVYGDHELGIWLRNAQGGVVRALQRTPSLSLLYRDSKTRTTLIFQGNGRIEADDAVRERVYALSPEVEQTHDPERRGAALIVDVERLRGTSPRGPVRMERGG